MGDFEKFQEKKTSTINIGINEKSEKTLNIPKNPGVPNGAVLQSGQKARAGFEDSIKEKFQRILNHDYKSQKWISKDKNKRKARKNINANYKLVTGAKKNLTSRQKLERKAEFESRRDLSILASTNLSAFMNEREKKEKNLTDEKLQALSKELLDMPLETFDFDSDKAFLKSFNRNMAVLDAGDRLSKALSNGDKIEGFDPEMMRELSIKLSQLSNIREAYEDRITIISSPFYVSIRSGDLTLSSIDRLNRIAKGKVNADESLKSFAKAITRWKSYGAGLFSIGKAANNDFFTDTIAENIILKNGIENVNNAFNSIKWKKEKNGKLSQKKIKDTREVQIKEWIYDDLKLLKDLDRKQLSKKIGLLIRTLENAEISSEDKEERVVEQRKKEEAIAHAKKAKAAFDEGRYSKESVILWLDRYLMSDHRLCISVYERAQEQDDQRSKEERSADHEAYLDEISDAIERFINSTEGLEAHFQNQKDPVEEKKKADEIEEKRKKDPAYEEKNLAFQKVHFVGEKDEKAKERHDSKGKDKLVKASKGAVLDQLTAGISDFLHIYGENSSDEILTRTYISVKPSSKGRSVKALVDTAINMGIQKELYFKISTTARKSRADDIVIYFGKNLTADQVSDFLYQYKKNCEAEKVEFSKGMEGVVVGKNYSPGINLAPEPSIAITLNKKIEDNDRTDLVQNKHSLDAFLAAPYQLSPVFSFTGLMVDLLFKSAVLAGKELSKSAKDDIKMGDPKTFALTKKYFRELCELNGIDTKNIVDESILKAFDKKEKEDKNKKKEKINEIKEKADPIDDLLTNFEGGDKLFSKVFKSVYKKALDTELRTVARRLVTEAKRKEGIKAYHPKEEEIRANMPSGPVLINDERVLDFVSKFREDFLAGKDSAELDRERTLFKEELEAERKEFPPALNAKLCALIEAMKQAASFVERRQALLNEQDGNGEAIQEVEYKEKDLKDERQDLEVSCWACSGTMNANNYIAKHKDVVDPGFVMTQKHFLSKKNLILNPAAKNFAMQDEKNLNRIKSDIESAKAMTGGREAMGNLFTMADVYLKNMSDTAVRRTQFNISKDDPILTDPEAVSAIEKGMQKKISELLILSGGPISMYYPGHYITVTGVKNGVILYHDSLAEKRADPTEKKKKPDVEDHKQKRAKLDATFEMTTADLLKKCVNGAVELVALTHLDEESIEGIKNEFKAGEEGAALYDQEGRLDPSLENIDDIKAADTERMFHNLGVEIEKPVQKDNALSKLGFMQDTIYLPKRREHRANVENNLPKQDLLEKADKKEEKIVKTQQKTEEKKEEKKPEKKAEKKAAIPEKTDNSPHSANFFQMYSKAMEETDQGKTWIMQHAPLNETLGVSYRTGSFKYRLSKKEREQKIKDPASLLYRKAENAALLVETVSDFETASFDAVNRAVTRQAFRIEKDEYLDLSAFMKEGDDKANFELAALYLGKSVKMQGLALEGQDVFKALDLMAEQLFLFDVGSLDLSDDTALVKNAAKLESLSAKVAAFDRLMKKHGYIDTLKPENQERLSERLNSLRSIAAYYELRKEIITNEVYKTHLNDELSLNKTGDITEEQSELSEKLLDSLVLGRTMMSLSGIKVGKDVFGGDGLDFKDAVMNTRYAKIKREYASASKHKNITAHAFAQKIERSQKELERLQKRLKELNAIDPIIEQNNIQKDMASVRHKAAVPVQGPNENMTLIKKLKSYFSFGWRWFSAVPVKTLTGVFGLTLPSGGKEKEGVQKKRTHKMVPGRKGEEFRDEIVRKDEEGEDIDIYSDVRRGPLVWEKLTAGDPEDPPEVCIMMKQAKRGDKVALKGLDDMGHAMISLTYSRYNKTTKRKERYQLRMGFWPGKGQSIFAPASLVNGAVMGGSLQDDGGQAYDVALRYQVKPGDINKILRASEKYADKGYTAFKRNCTTFVIDMAKTINLPIVKELEQKNLSLKGVGGALVHMARGANHPGIAVLTGKHMASKMNKMDLSYQNFGQKLYTKEELDRFYKTAQYNDDEIFGYAPGPVGEQMRSAKSGELSAFYEEDKDLNVNEIKNEMRSLGSKIAETAMNEIPEEERTKEDQDVWNNALQIDDYGLDDLIKSGDYTSADLKEAHKAIRTAAKKVSDYYKNRLKQKASLNADIMRFLSLCEVLLTVIDQQYRKIIKKEVKGDAGTLKYDFVNIEKEFVFTDKKGVQQKIKVAPGVFEGYLLAGKTVDEAVRDIQRKEELSAREETEKDGENENDGEQVKELTGAEKKELKQLKIVYDLADDFSGANRYLLEKEDFDEKDVRYAFKELPAMENSSKVLTANEVTRMEYMPSATYQAVIFESLLGGIRDLSLDKLPEAEQRAQVLDRYMTDSFKAKPVLSQMILRYFAEGQGMEKSIEELKEEFSYLISCICLNPPYKGTNFSSGDATFCSIRLISPGAAFNDYLTEQFESIKKTLQDENAGKENNK